MRCFWFLNFFLFVCIYINVLLYFFSYFFYRLAHFFISLQFYRALSHSSRRASCPENRNIEIVCICIYIYTWIKAAIAMVAVLSWVFNIFLMWIQEEWERESFLFASLGIESIYTFLCSFHSSYIYFWWHQVLSVLLLSFHIWCSPFKLKLRFHF